MEIDFKKLVFWIIISVIVLTFLIMLVLKYQTIQIINSLEKQGALMVRSPVEADISILGIQGFIVKNNTNSP